MKKLIKIIGFILFIFILLSFFLYRLRLGNLTTLSRPAPGRQDAAAIKRVEGEINDVDLTAGTLHLMDGDRQLLLEFDEKTMIREAGQVAPLSAMQSGLTATVNYVEGAGRNRARRIELLKAPRPQGGGAGRAGDE